MGQCSTLPTEAKHPPRGTSSQQQRDDKSTVYHRYKHKEHTMMSESSENSKSPLTHFARKTTRRGDDKLQVNVAGGATPGKSPARAYAVSTPTPPSNYNSTAATYAPEPMQEDDPAPPAPIATPPSSAKRIRCYKLNLESDFAGLSSSNVKVEGSLLGPYAQEPPPLTYSASDDSSTHHDPTTVAIRTAQIFRGITVDRNGTILTQNARATRSNRGNKQKRGEKSRQAAKIDKAKDLVEEAMETGLAPNSKEPANLVSLYIMGEYDEMKYLVRDGSKKLRETAQYPDEVLLSFNRTRGTSPFRSSRKRVSPSSMSSRPPMSTPLGSAPPKLKGHPRDRPSSRRHVVGHDKQQESPKHGSSNNTPRSSYSRNNSGPSLVQESSCFSPQNGAEIFHSIWNCGHGAGQNGGGSGGSASPTTHVKDRKVYSSNPAGSATPPTVPEGRNDQWEETATSTHQIRI